MNANSYLRSSKNLTLHDTSVGRTGSCVNRSRVQIETFLGTQCPLVDRCHAVMDEMFFVYGFKVIYLCRSTKEVHCRLPRTRTYVIQADSLLGEHLPR